MQNADKKRFAEALYGTMDVVGGRVTDRAMSVWWETLKPYPIESVVAALEAHVRQSVYPPKPADVISAISEHDGRPGAEEAWGVALQARDESETVIWTEETAQAMAACHEILQAGDKVGARMAFKERYEKLVADARAQQRPIRWQVSLGHDPERRQQALQQAVEAGQIGHDRAAALIGHTPEPSQEAVGYLEHDGPAVSEDEARRNIQQLRSMIAEAMTEPEQQGEA